MATNHKMVYILSEDYWGFDNSTKDDSTGFYKNTWTLPKSQYDSMSDETDRAKLYRCALFYVTDKTDNHGFTPVAIQSQNDVVIVGQVSAGTVIRRMYTKGQKSGYETGGDVMRQADPAATTFEELKDMATSSPGEFMINEFIFDNESAIKTKVEELQSELGQINAAESYASEAPADVALDASEPLMMNPTTEAASGSELITDQMDTSLNLFAEGDMTPADKLALKRKRRMESKLRAIKRRPSRKKMKMESETSNAIIQFEENGYSSASVPPTDIHFGADSQLMTTQAVGQAGSDYDHEIHYRAELESEDFPTNFAAQGRKRKYGKRQRFDHIKGNSRYVARNAKGQFISNVGVSNSIKADLRSSAKTQQPVGFRNQGDAMVRRAEATPSVVDAAEPMDYQPYEFIDEMDSGEYISSDDFMMLLADTVDGMSLRYRPPMYRSPLAMAGAGAVLAVIGMKLLKK
jgi:hypothetical protein